MVLKKEIKRTKMKKLKTTLALLLLGSMCYSQSLNSLQTKEKKNESLVLLAYTVAFSGANTLMMYKSEQFPKPVVMLTLGIPLTSLTYVGITHKNEIKRLLSRKMRRSHYGKKAILGTKKF